MAFVDLGSDVVTIREDEAKRLQIKYNPRVTSRLRGFGNSTCQTLGERKLILIIDNVDIEVACMIVPKEAQEEKMIIGRSALDQPGIRIVKQEKKLEITRENSEVREDENSEVCEDEDSEGDENSEDSEVEESEDSKVRKYEVLEINQNENATEDKETEKFEDGHRKILNMQRNFEENQIVIGDVREDTRKEVLNLINQNRQCFAENLREVGKVQDVKFEIKLKDDTPVCQKPYRVPYLERHIMNEVVSELLEADIIEASESEYASPAILVGKPNGDKKLCIDYTGLTAKTIKDKFPMDNMDDVLNRLNGNKFFTVVDMCSGYYQLEVGESSRKYTAFAANEGQYQFKRMPFGLVNAPAAFNRAMRKLRNILPPGDIEIYMDDVLVPSKTEEEGVEKLRRLFEAIGKMGLTMKMKKCKLQKKIDFVGFEVSEDGIAPGRKNTEAIMQYARPETVKEVRQFLGLCNFFRRFVRNINEEG